MTAATSVTYNPQKVLVALSGGVDSAVCALLLKEQGFLVEGTVLSLSPAHKSAVEGAQRTADALGIPLHVLREEALFYQKVITPFAKSYLSGETPNPCILCNPSVKFHLIAQQADAIGASFFATGHYARINQQQGVYYVGVADCLPRDQSYMLYRLPQTILSRLLLPLAHLTKDEVRQIALAHCFPCAQAPDSQENCFIPDNNYAQYIETHFCASPPGEFIGPDGRICGMHKGIIHYTVGQRKGLGISLGRPVVVLKIDPSTNRIYLGEPQDAYYSSIDVENTVYTSPQKMSCQQIIFVKVRSAAKAVLAKFLPQTSDQCQVIFSEPQRAPAKGQSAVFYDENGWVLGGGFIRESYK